METLTFDFTIHVHATKRVGKKDMRSLNWRFTGANPQIDFAKKSGEVCQLGINARNGLRKEWGRMESP